MKLWRISNYSTLDGIGGVRAGGRWHNRGIPVTYLSESPALAMLETLVHLELDPSEIPDSYQLLEVECPEAVTVSRLSDNALDDTWRTKEEFTRAIGDEWLTRGTESLLAVPSALVPDSYNYLLNPRHEDAKHLSVLTVRTHPYDSRLLELKTVNPSG